jgi:hypothetical protein
MTSMQENPNDSGFSAEVNGNPIVTLYNLNGDRVEVESVYVDTLIAAGFRRTKLDISEQKTNLLAMFDAAKAAASRFIDGVVGDGSIDPNDDANYEASQKAMSLLGEAYLQIFADLHALFPLAQGTGVLMNGVDEDGKPAVVEVDPNQADLYIEKGFTVAK